MTPSNLTLRVARSLSPIALAVLVWAASAHCAAALVANSPFSPSGSARSVSAAPDSYQSQPVDATVLFQNLVGQAHQCALNFGGRHQLRLLVQCSFADRVLLNSHECECLESRVKLIIARLRLRGFRSGS